MSLPRCLLVVSVLAHAVAGAQAPAPCHDGRIVFHLVTEAVRLHVEGSEGRQDPRQALTEIASDQDALRSWRLLAPLTRALKDAPDGVGERAQLREALRVRGCTVVDDKEDVWKERDSLAWFASAANMTWGGSRYDHLVVRVAPLITAKADRFVLQSRAMFYRHEGMERPLRFDLEHRSAPLPGATEAERVTALAADGARRYLELRAAAIDEVVEFALRGPWPHDARATDAKFGATGDVVGRHAGRTLVRFPGRIVSGPDADPLPID